MTVSILRHNVYYSENAVFGVNNLQSIQLVGLKVVVHVRLQMH